MNTIFFFFHALFKILKDFLKSFEGNKPVVQAVFVSWDEGNSYWGKVPIGTLMALKEPEVGRLV